MNGKKSGEPFYNKIEEYLLAFFFSLMVIITGFTVFSRYLFSFTFSWAEQATRIFFVWITFIGISLAAYKSRHLKVTAVTLVMSKKAGERLIFFGDFVSFLFGFYIAYYILDIIIMTIQKGQVFPSMPWLPTWTMYMGGVLGMIGFSLRLLQVSIVPFIRDNLLGGSRAKQE